MSGKWATIFVNGWARHYNIIEKMHKTSSILNFVQWDTEIEIENPCSLDVLHSLRGILDKVGPK